MRMKLARMSEGRFTVPPVATGTCPVTVSIRFTVPGGCTAWRDAPVVPLDFLPCLSSEKPRGKERVEHPDPDTTVASAAVLASDIPSTENFTPRTTTGSNLCYPEVRTPVP